MKLMGPEPVTPPSPAAPKPLDQLTDSQLADLFGDADLKVQQRENAEAKRDKFRNELQRRFDTAEATEDHFVEGLRWSVRLSPRRKETKLKSAWAVYKALNLKNARALVDLIMGFVPLWFLEEKLGKAAVAVLVTSEQTGYRFVKAVAQSAPAVELPKAA